MKYTFRLVTTIVAVFAVVALIAVYIFSFYTNDSQKSSADLQLIQVSTRLKWFPYASYIDNYIAKEKGFWQNGGLDVRIDEGGPTVDAVKLVAAGSNDFGIAGADQLLVARSKGLDVVAISALMQESPAGFMVRADSGINTMKDFKGKRIRIIPGHNTEIEYRAAMKFLGIGKDEVREIINTSELQLFLAGEVDIEPVYLNNQPARAHSLGVQFKIIKPSDHGVHSYGNVYFTTSKMISEHPDVVQKFVDGSLAGWEYAFENPENSVDILLSYAPKLKKDEELEKLSLTKPLMYRQDGRVGWMEKARWQEVNDFLHATEQIDSSFKDIDSVYDNRFVETYHKKKGSL